MIHALSRGLAKGQARDVADNLCAYASTKRTAEQTLRLLEKQLVRRPHQAEWVLPLVRWGWGCQVGVGEEGDAGGEGGVGGWGAEGAYSFVACLTHLTVDHASLSRRSTVPSPKFWRLLRFSHLLNKSVCLSFPLPVSLSVATIYLLE